MGPKIYVENIFIIFSDVINNIFGQKNLLT